MQTPKGELAFTQHLPSALDLGLLLALFLTLSCAHSTRGPRETGFCLSASNEHATMVTLPLRVHGPHCE